MLNFLLCNKLCISAKRTRKQSKKVYTIKKVSKKCDPLSASVKTVVMMCIMEMEIFILCLLKDRLLALSL